MFMGIKMRVQ